MAGIKDIAKAAGLSFGMESRVLNHNHGSPQTRARVLAAAEALNYRPNAAARSMVTGRSHLLAMFAWKLDSQWIGDLIRSMQFRARHLGYEMMIIAGKLNRATENRVIDMLLERKVEGLAHIQPRNDHGYYRRLKEEHNLSVV